MKIIFVSNYLSPHQLPLCLAFDACEEVDFKFIATAPIGAARIKLGYKDIDGEYPFVIKMYADEDAGVICKKLIQEADSVIVGTAPWQLFEERIRCGGLTFRYSERQLKKGLELHKYLPRYLRWHKYAPRNKPCYLLCASGYAAYDFSLFGLYKNKAYKWGYFPQTKYYESIDTLIAGKKENSLVWVARYIDWKHPEIAVEIARRLKADGYAFSLDMIGNGAMLDEITQMVKAEGLDDVIHIHGAMSPEEVRGYMEKAQIHIFTSDRNEGWGAVLNEAMNSACVPIANVDIGSAPFLIEDGVNGFTYRNMDELYEKVKYLLENKNICEEMAHKAYQTIVDEWNAENAAEKLLTLSGKILNGEKNPDICNKGVCSKARISR